jgi:argininosuccinate synthase
MSPKLSQILQWCNTLENTPDTSVQVEVYFEKGIPTKINGELKKLSLIVAELNTL